MYIKRGKREDGKERKKEQFLEEGELRGRRCKYEEKSEKGKQGKERYREKGKCGTRRDQRKEIRKNERTNERRRGNNIKNKTMKER